MRDSETNDVKGAAYLAHEDIGPTPGCCPPRASLMANLPPKGYRIERHENDNSLRQETTFTVIEAHPNGDYEVTKTRAAYSNHRGGWYVEPGATTNRVSPDEARARAAALCMAADEVERRISVDFDDKR